MILVVDDHTNNRDVLLRLLKREGYALAGADCGEGAMKTLGSVTRRT